MKKTKDFGRRKEMVSEEIYKLTFPLDHLESPSKVNWFIDKHPTTKAYPSNIQEVTLYSVVTHS